MQTTSTTGIIVLPLEALKITSTTGAAPSGSLTYTNPASNSGVAKIVKCAAAETVKVIIPINLQNYNFQFGTEIIDVDLPLNIGTANLSGPATATLYQTLVGNAQPGTPTNLTANTIPGTVNTVQNANAADQVLKFTVTNPAFQSGYYFNQGLYKLEVALPCASSTVLTIYDAYATFLSLA
jgi:hypothetical protein